MSHHARHRSWHWYAAVVPAIAFALAASSFRYVDIALPNSPSDPISGAAGETLHIEQTAEVEGVDNLIVADVTLTHAALVRAEDTPSLGDTEIDVIAVDFDWSAPPESPLRTCDMRLLTEDGTPYLPAPRLGARLSGAPPELTNTYYCAPEDTPGPFMDMGVDLGVSDYQDPPRPESWSTTVYFVVPAGTRPGSVEVIWQTPTYLEFTGVSLDSAELALSSLSSAGAMNTSAAAK
ncbi:MAG: hypothetical protein Q4G50_01990 [Corynebacterium sp.]|uniref:hypothetical protein n=1 Tax=Corynebacterium sp. TaxID=1720 RepID=UPI0026DF63D4|nr:hypothetical protein [Corynebacterium sp.]MDO5668753.1 hypothetical protein [Corynebacterium sp.]